MMMFQSDIGHFESQRFCITVFADFLLGSKSTQKETNNVEIKEKT